MKNVFTLILAFGAIYLSSCNNNNNSSTTVIPVADSVSKGGSFQVSFTNDSSIAENFFMNDYTSNGHAVITLFASVAYSPSDSLWHLQLQTIDQKLKQVAVIFYGKGDTSAIGTYTNTTNNSTLIDYTNGENFTYAISIGSTVTITQSSYPIQGTFNFNLYHNSFTTTAAGSFTIYH